MSFLAASPANAVPQFTVVRDGDHFTVENNSNNWFIYGFEIERPPGTSSPSTSLANWSASTCISFCSTATSPAFSYFLNVGIDPALGGILPHTSSSLFSFINPGISDGTSNTIFLGEALDFTIFAIARATSIADGTSNTIIFSEQAGPIRFPEITDGTSNTIIIGETPSFPVRIGFRGIQDGTSNTIFIGETFVTETPVPGALPLMGSALGLGLLIARLRRRRRDAPNSPAN